MKRPDPRILRAEKLLTEIGRLLAEIRAGVPARRTQPKRRRRYKLTSMLAALRRGASLDAIGDARDPRLPSRAVLARYRKSNRAFNREAQVLLKERGRASSRMKRRVAPNPGAAVPAQRMPGQTYDWNAIAAKIEAGATVGPYSPNRQGLPSHTLIMARRKWASVMTCKAHGRTAEPSSLEIAGRSRACQACRHSACSSECSVATGLGGFSGTAVTSLGRSPSRWSTQTDRMQYGTPEGVSMKHSTTVFTPCWFGIVLAMLFSAACPRNASISCWTFSSENPTAWKNFAFPYPSGWSRFSR